MNLGDGVRGPYTEWTWGTESGDHIRSEPGGRSQGTIHRVDLGDGVKGPYTL